MKAIKMINTIKYILLIIVMMSSASAFSQFGGGGNGNSGLLYRDGDGDGYGRDNDFIFDNGGNNPGYVSQSGDCNDFDNKIYPGAPELCDGKDNDCDGRVDESPKPGTPSSISVVNNCGSSVLTRGNPPSGITWYWQSSASGTSTANSAKSYTRTLGSVFYLRGRNNSTGCWGSARSVSYSIKFRPSIPSTPSVANNCGSTRLSRNNPPSGVTWYWQSSVSGTSRANSSVSVTRTSGTVYYLRGRNNSTGCWGDTRAINYSIRTVPSKPVIKSVVNNCGNSVLTRNNPPANVIWYWQSSLSGTSTANSSVSVTRTSGATYYLRAKHKNGCWGPGLAVGYSIKTIPTQPPLPSVSNQCGKSILTRGNPPSGITWYWQSSGSGTSLSDASVSITRYYGSNYYLRARNNSTGCWSSARYVPYTIKATPIIPDRPSATNNCGNTVLTRSNPPTGITWYWQSSSSGTSTANSSVSKTQTSGTIYYLRSRNNSTGCWGPATSISYTINPLPNWYKDVDGDGFATTKVTQCTNPGSGYVQTVLPLTDCNDNNSSIHPNTLWYADTDGDGFGDPNISKKQCTQPNGYVFNNGDQCTTIAGSMSGCEGSLYQDISLSNENYVFTRTFQSEMTSSNQIQFEKDVIEGVTYFDGLGRAKQQIAIKSSGTPSIAGSNNELTMDWTPGQGSTGFFNSNGKAQENNRINGPDPSGKQSLLWYCGNDVNSDADGGWNTDYFNVDKNIGYRYTVWVKRTGSNNGYSYHGTQNVNNLDGNANNNPYFWHGDLPQLDTWYLLVGVIHPYQYGGNNSGISGVYDRNGNKVLNGNDFKWRSNTTNSRFRSYLYYSTDASTNQYFWNPIVQKLDGNEASIETLIVGPQSETQDIVTHIEYDDYGRQTKQYLPFASEGTSGSYNTVNVTNDINNYYLDKYQEDFPGITNTAQVNAYSESVFEASPLNRVQEQGAPGSAWKADRDSDADHTIKFDWGTNTASEVVKFRVTFTNNDTEKPQLVMDNYYVAGELYVTITKDENWKTTDGDNHTTKEYKDKQGRVVLKRTYASTGSAGASAHDTYYVYDKFGNLTYVIPPKVITTDGVSNSELAELCYQYEYDNRNRLVEKKIPGKDWEYIIYNKLDQPVMTQDAKQRAKKEWLFTKYDAFGRVVYTGLHINPNVVTRVTMQNTANSDTYTQYVTKKNTGQTIAGTQVYYSNDAIPTGISKIYTINYYDDYDFDTAGITKPGTVYGVGTTDRTRSLATGSKVRVLGTNQWITTVTYYDKKARPIYVASKNEYLNTTDVLESKLDFAGKVLATKTTHTKGSNAAIVTIDTYTYDHMGRMMKQSQKINNQAEELIASNTYDALGQLTSKKVGGTSTTLSGSNGSLSGAEGLQTVDYNYNIRGWLKTINNGTTAGGDLFGFALDYNAGANPLYNGNISATSWQTANDHVSRSYNYTYDALNRITSGISNDGKYDLSEVSYDKMGNIMSLNRKGHLNNAATSFGNMDLLSYTYDSGNKLLKVADNGNDTFGFKDGTNTNDDFEYDENGNMIIDRNKGISNITYNHLNLPTTVSISNTEGTGTISYIYDATGTKLKKAVTEGGSITNTEYAGKYVYKNGGLQYMSTPEGYATPTVTSSGVERYRYAYQYRDHLDNVRLSYTKNDTGTLEIIEENNYYPFGLKHKGYNNTVSSLGNSTAQLLGFGNKEEQNELGLEWLDFEARNYDPAMGRWMNIDPLAEQMRRHSPYNYAFNNPIRFIDPDGMAPFTDFYNLYGNHVKHVDDGKNDKKLVLTNSKNKRKVNNAINNGEVVNVVSDEVVDKIETAYDKSEATGNEFGFVVGDNGKSSKLVEGDSGQVGPSEWREAKKDLADKSRGDDSTPAFDVHVHPLEKDSSGNVVGFGLPKPSDTDVKPENNRGFTEPSIVAGYEEQITPPPSGTIGGTSKREYVRNVGFYTTKGLINTKKISFERYKRAINGINKK